MENGSFEGSLKGWAGWKAQLVLASDGIEGAGATRVTGALGATSFTIDSSPRTVQSTESGAAYTATAWVRSDQPGHQLCLRVREWTGQTVLGSAQRCLTGATAWQSFAPFVYTSQGAGRQLDIYVYETGASAGDSFEVDGIALRGTAAPAPTPTPTTSVSATTTTVAATTTSVSTQTTTTAPAPTTTAAPPPTTTTVAPPPPTTSPPAGLSATPVDNSHVQLTWAAVDGAAGYRVRRGSIVLGTTLAKTFTDALLWPSSVYSYEVEALGAAGSVLSTYTTSVATSSLPAGGFLRPFSSSSFWNVPVGSASVATNSASLAAYFAANAVNPNMPIRSWAVGVAEAHSSDPQFNVPCLKYTCTLGAFGAFGIPITALPDPSSDGHLAVYDPAAGREWDMWQAKRDGSGWTASAGAAVSMAGDGVAPAGTASGDAANFPLLGGLIRPEEIAQGYIDHALVFEMPGVGAGRPVCPATHNAGSSTDPNALREGQKLQLDPSIDVELLQIPAWQKTIAYAMQRYGMYLRDGSGSLAILAENPASRGYDAWTLVGMGSGSSVSLPGIPWNRFRVLAAPNC